MRATPGEAGKLWQSRYPAVRLMGKELLLACAAYVDLHPIRPAMPETLEASDHTSVQRRIEAQRAETVGSGELGGELGSCGNRSGGRCSDKGFLRMSVAEYLQLLDWTSRQTLSGKYALFSLFSPVPFFR